LDACSFNITLCMYNYIQQHQAPTGGGSSTPTGEPVVQVSPHVFVPANDPQAAALAAAYQWAAAYEAKLHGAQDEFNVWWRACTISPQAGACSGQFKGAFSGLMLNTRLEELINQGFEIRLNNQGNITGLVLSGVVFGPARRYLYRSGGNTLQNKTPNTKDMNPENPDEYGFSMSQDPNIFKKAYIIDQADLDKLYVVVDPTETDPLHVMLQTATREEFADWVATRPNLPVGVMTLRWRRAWSASIRWRFTMRW
jgi:hypothetical protein